MMAVIGSMAAILVHERKRIREIEAGTETIRQVRRDISEAHRCITRLALLGEGVVGWDETDYRHYHAQLEKPRDFDPFGQAGLSPLATI